MKEVNDQCIDLNCDWRELRDAGLMSDESKLNKCKGCKIYINGKMRDSLKNRTQVLEVKQ